ncbi:MAG: hypothetical protein ACRDWY_03070 [Actinomycetes bacterium]
MTEVALTVESEELTLPDLDQLDEVMDDDELDGDEPGGELSDEVDPGCSPDDAPVTPVPGPRS